MSNNFVKNQITTVTAIILVDTSTLPIVINNFEKSNVWVPISIILILNILVYYFTLRYFKSRITIPTLKNRFILSTSSSRFEQRSINKNKVLIEVFHVINKLKKGTGNMLDCDVAFIFKGKTSSIIKEFKFSIASSKYTEFEQLNMTASDKISKKSYKVELNSISSDTPLKDVSIIIEPPFPKGVYFDLCVKWTWIKIFKLNEGCIGLPNYFSKSTKKIILELDLTESSLISPLITAYNYKATKREPDDISEIIHEDNRIHRIQVIDPVMNSDYYLYYEKRDI